VDRGDDPPARVHEKYGEAVGGFDYQQNARKASHHGIPLEVLLGKRVDELNDVGMNLPENDGMEMFQLFGFFEIGFAPGSVAKPVDKKRNPVKARDVNHLFSFSRHYLSLNGSAKEATLFTGGKDRCYN
jgi:hypothetical protein